MRSKEHIETFDLLERIADGLRIPGRLLGLAARPWEQPAPTRDMDDEPTAVTVATSRPTPATEGEDEPDDLWPAAASLLGDDDGWTPRDTADLADVLGSDQARPLDARAAVRSPTNGSSPTHRR
jgi:hypothetical protein